VFSDKVLFFTLLAIAAAVVLLSPLFTADWYATVYEENGVIEVLTALAYGLAALIALVSAIKIWRKSGIGRVVVGLLAFVAFALFLVAEEVSLWVIFMSSEPPRVLGIKMDAAHDILHLGLKAIKSLIAYSVPLGLSVVGLLGLTGVALFYHFRHAVADGIKAVLSTQVGTFILICIGLGCAALVADLRSETIHILKSVEEGLELAASLSLVIAAWYAAQLASE